MKNATLFLSALLIAISGAVMAGGSDDASSSSEPVITLVPQQSESIYKLIYVSDKKVPVKVTLINNQGQKLQIDRIVNEKGFMRPYNLSNLPTGEYQLEVNDGGSIITKTLQLGILSSRQKNGSLSVNTTKDEQRVKLTVLGVEDKPVYIKVYDRFNRLVMEDVVDVRKNFSKTYDFSKMSLDGFTFEVANEKAIVRKNI
jgi:hypothetical protein